MITLSYGYSLKYRCNELLNWSGLLVLSDRNLSQMSLSHKGDLLAYITLDGQEQSEFQAFKQYHVNSVFLFPSLGCASLSVGFILKQASYTWLQRQPLAALGLHCFQCLQSQKRPFHNQCLYQSLKKSQTWLYL